VSKFWSEIKGLFKEWILTFSNDKSFFSSKRIERFIILAAMLSLTIYFVVKAINECKISAAELMIVVGTWLSYAGFNTIQIKNDKKTEDNGQG